MVVALTQSYIKNCGSKIQLHKTLTMGKTERTYQEAF